MVSHPRRFLFGGSRTEGGRWRRRGRRQAHLTDEGQLYYFNPITIQSQAPPPSPRLGSPLSRWWMRDERRAVKMPVRGGMRGDGLSAAREARRQGVGGIATSQFHNCWLLEMSMRGDWRHNGSKLLQPGLGL